MIEIRPLLHEHFNSNEKLVNLLGGYDIGGKYCSKIRNDVGEDHVKKPMVIWDLMPLTIDSSSDFLFLDHEERLVFYVLTDNDDEVLNIQITEEVNRMARSMRKLNLDGTTIWCNRNDRGAEFFNDSKNKTSVRNLYFTIRYQENEK